MLIDKKIIHDLPVLGHIDQVGIAPVKTLRTMPNLLDLEGLLPDAKVVIVLSAHMPADAVKQAGKPPAENVMSYSFLQYQITREVMWAATDLSGWLEAEGEHAVPILDLSLKSFPSPSYDGMLPDLRANAVFAVTAGLGGLGLSGLLLTPKYGPHQKFSFVLTTADLPPTPYEGSTLCTQCKKCIVACPVQALNADTLEEILIGKRKYTRCLREETRCRWARCLGMVPEAGPMYMGWKDPGLSVPDELTDEKVKEAIQHKDPLQRIAYRDPFWIDAIVERCLQVCPVGTGEDDEK